MAAIWVLLTGILVVVGALLWLRLHAFLALLLGALAVGILTSETSIEKNALERGMSQASAKQLSLKPVGERVADGFGTTAGQIGILVALASIVGKCMLDSGAADRIVRSILRVLGEGRAPLAFLASGFLLGIPVFFDTVFYLMIPLGKAMRMRTGRNYLFYVLTIIAGATMTHSLVPPTPGPLFAASALKVDLGLMIAGGCIVGAFTSAFGYLYARWANKQWEIPLRESPDLSLARLEELSGRKEEQLPPAWLSFSPIVLPVVLIGGKALYDSLRAPATSSSLTGWQQELLDLILSLGDKNLAMGIATAIALGMLLWNRVSSGESASAAVQSAIMGAGVIILITSAGGAFGVMLQQSGIGSWVKEFSGRYTIGVIPLAFFMTALIRTAQGSATVAMITAAGTFSGMATSADLGFHPLYVALAIGCGSKPIWWMNDSGFWVVSKMSGMTEAETLKTATPMSALMGVVGLLITMIGARLFPLV